MALTLGSALRSGCLVRFALRLRLVGPSRIPERSTNRWPFPSRLSE